ncbi:MAG: 5-deoxy-glucuronate isomerase [Synergistaceae bacterium]|nr:5-deoxy-glucuronate isomerase [Synergistaceae bacterium]
MYMQKEVTRGYNAYLTMGENDCATNMDIGLLVMFPGDEYTFKEAEKELALDLLIGKVSFTYNGESHEAVRENTFRNAAYCLHVCKGTHVTVKALEHAEIYVQKTDNEREFAAKLYAPSDIMVQHAGANGELLGCMQREIQTFFDYESAPYSNMVLGEVLSYPGKWSSYPPHHHPQPEVYFYRFDYPQGFGAGFADGEVYQTGHNGCLVINHSFHSQAAAPGYAMCYMWGIRHLPGNPWRKTRIDDPEHSWLWKSDANEHIFKPQEAK